MGLAKGTLCGIVLFKLNTFFSHVFASPTSFHPVWYTSILDFPKNYIFSVVLYSTLQLVCNSSKKKLILQTLECKKCLFPTLKMMAFCYLPSPVEPW
jgi:hypothetical protein